jgi:choline dehydrogenase-like flavoprotein
VRVAVIGAGVAGCAAAVAAAQSGAEVRLLESGHHLGGVAVRGEHRSICGLAAIDAAAADLLEPGLTAAWVARVASGAAYRRGRVWLWPCTAASWQRGLAAALAAVDVHPQFGSTVAALRHDGQRWRDDPLQLEADVVIDASGQAIAAQCLGAPMASASAWPAHRCRVQVDAAQDYALQRRGGRVAALRRIATALGSQAACALEAGVDAGDWQLSLDLPPDTSASSAARLAATAAAAIDARVVAHSWLLATRDDGRPAAALDAASLFATTARGWCWAAWPVEQHGPDGVTWRWPPGQRYGIPRSATRLPGVPPGLHLIGKGMPVGADAAAALRVTGTALALGTALGRAVATAD